jgi:photosystem II stability/assembly factor-like uncharacterized protein
MHPLIKQLILTVCILVTGWTQLSAQWEEVQLPAPYNRGYYLDVFFLPSNPQYGWACSIEGYIIRTTDGGTTWQGSQIPNAFLEYVQFLTPQVGYTSGEAGVFRSTDGGRSWQDISPFDPNREKGWGSYWINQREGLYFVGGCATGLQGFFRTTDAGQSWSVFYTSEPLSGLSDGLIFRDGSGYAVSSGVLWRTEDFGRTWRFYSSTGAKIWTEELSVVGNSILLPTSGTNCDGNTRGVGSLRFSRDAGRTWRESSTGSNMFGTFLIDERRGWGVGDERTVLYTEDYGQSWTRRNCGIRGNVDDVWFINDTLGWCVGDGVYKTNFSAPKPDVRIEPDARVVELCEGEVLDVRVITAQTAIKWNDGASSPTRALTTAGVYAVTVYDPATCQSASDTIELRFRPSTEPTITLSKPFVCEGDSITLTVEGPFVSFLWSTGDTTRSIVASTAGQYTCTVVDTNGCTRSAAATAVIHPNPEPTIQANRPLRICLDEVVVLSAPSGFDVYQWSSGESSQSITAGEGGTWYVTVIDSFGCIGVSDTVTVVKLETRNKAEIQFASASDSSIVVQDHPIGTIACGDVVVRNRSTTEPLVIARPYLLGNVFVSIPQSQLPVVIAPQEVGRFTLCVSAIDTGRVVDTLALPDTCSTWYIPVRSNGQPLTFQGTSRCNVDVMTLVYSAGDAWRLSDPFPMPVSGEARIGALLVRGAPQRDVQVLLCDVTGRVVGEWTYEVRQGASTDLTLDVGHLTSGSYTLHLVSGGVRLRSSTILVHR